MKKFLRQTLSLALAISMLASVSALASDALGVDLTEKNTPLHQGTQLSTNVFWSSTFSDLRRENVITYEPGSPVVPVVDFGDVLTARGTVTAGARELEAQGYRVLAGINGDFYDTGTGLPIGLAVSEGSLQSSDGGYYAIGFRADGTSVLGKPGITVTADLGYTVLDAAGYESPQICTVAGVNKARVSTGGVYLYTYQFNVRHTTGATEPGVDVVCTFDDGSLSIGGSAMLTVQQVIEGGSATAVPENGVVLSVNAKSSEYHVNLLRNMTAGSTVTVTVNAADPAWYGVDYAVGALYSLVENGAVPAGLPSGAAPRTAVGQRADGSLVFYTIDGRKPGHSIGASLTQVGQRLVELGCVTGLGLDGGGSTALSVTLPDADSSSGINRPSDGAERSVTNRIYLVAPAEPTGELDHFYVEADNQYVLAGSQVTLKVSGVDSGYMPMDAKYSLSASGGTLLDNTLTTPASGGEITVTATGRGRSGETTIHAVTDPDSIAVKSGSAAVTELTVPAGATAQLTASAVYRHLSLKADPSAFTWVASAGVGTVDADGKFTAGLPGTGYLTVSAGGKTVTIPVTVSKMSLRTVEDFETAASYSGFVNSGSGIDPTRVSGAEQVRFGRWAGQMAYTLDSQGTAFASAAFTLDPLYTQLNLWVLGDGSGNQLSVMTTDGSQSVETVLTDLDFTGWKQVSVTLPAGAVALTELVVTGWGTPLIDELGGEYLSFEHGTGTVGIDQIVASYNEITDNDVPVITAALDGAGLTITGTVSDEVDGIPARDAVTAAINGAAADFAYDAVGGEVTVTLPAAGETREAARVTITARDASGNIGRVSVDVPAVNAEHHFSDIEGYWAATSVDFLQTTGVTNGYADGTFRPDRNISRQEFAVMLFRYLRMEESRYADVALPFADSNQIGDFAQTAVKALYTEGIINGSAGKDGKLYFNPGSSLTRAEAAAMIGRTQTKGYATAPLTFTDAAAIPAYASFYIQTMAAQGIIGGYTNGAFGPGDRITRGQMAKILYNAC